MRGCLTIMMSVVVCSGVMAMEQNSVNGSPPSNNTYEWITGMTTPLCKSVGTLHRFYDSRTNPTTQRKILGLEPDSIENHKTTEGYKKVQESYGYCSDVDIDFFMKRSYIAIKYGNQLCGLNDEKCTSKTVEDIRLFLENNSPTLPPWITEKLQNKEKRVTGLLTKNMVGAPKPVEPQLSPEQQAEILRGLIAVKAINGEAFNAALNEKKQKAAEKAEQETELIFNQHYLEDYFKTLKHQSGEKK
jgi:hypothetical protein